MKEFVGSLKLELAQYREMEIFASFGSELDVTTQQILVRGERLVELLKQAPYKPMSLDQQLILLFAGRNGYLDKLTMAQVDDFKEFIMDWFKDSDAIMAIQNLLDLEDEIVRDLTLDFIVREIVEVVKN